MGISTRSIYTRSGDAGETSLFGGLRVKKDDLRIEVCGSIDELSASLGLVRAEGVPHWETLIVRVQHELFDFCTEIVSEKAGTARITPEHVIRLEEEIDRLESVLPPLNRFVVPGANRLSAMLHSSRTICRRAERVFTTLFRCMERPPLPVLAAYLNRLSDLLFILARAAETKGDAVTSG